MNNLQLTYLAEQAARAMAGRPVVLRFKQPARADAKACAFRLHGAAFIDITPGLGEQDFLFCLAHEAGHIRDLWGEWKVDVTDHPAGSIRYNPALAALPVVKAMEKTAGSLADSWLAYAEQNAHKYPGGWLESRLRALAGWLEPELQAKIARWTTEAATEAVKTVLARNNR